MGLPPKAARAGRRSGSGADASESRRSDAWYRRNVLRVSFSTSRSSQRRDAVGAAPLRTRDLDRTE